MVPSVRPVKISGATLLRPLPSQINRQSYNSIRPVPDNRGNVTARSCQRRRLTSVMTQRFSVISDKPQRSRLLIRSRLQVEKSLKRSNLLSRQIASGWESGGEGRKTFPVAKFDEPRANNKGWRRPKKTAFTCCPHVTAELDGTSSASLGFSRSVWLDLICEPGLSRRMKTKLVQFPLDGEDTD